MTTQQKLKLIQMNYKLAYLINKIMLDVNITPHPPNLMPKLSISKKQEQGQDSSNTKDTHKGTNKKRQQHAGTSEQVIKYQDDKSKYKAILKNQFLNSNLKRQDGTWNKNKNDENEEKSFAFTLRSLQRKVHKVSNIIVMLKTEYPIIHNLIHKYFNYKFYNKEDHFNDVFLLWMDTYVTQQFVKRVKSYQRINHFPSSCELGRKDLLSLNLKHAKRLMKDEYSFYPKTWVLPKQYDLFCDQKEKGKLLIVKPHANCQGRGIYLSKNPSLSIKDEVIVQQYFDNPMLIDGCKFDLRIYVLLRSLDPLRIYVYKEGLCRLATSQYTKPNQTNIKNDKMHLTNYAINKLDPNFVGNKDLNKDNQGHKRSYTSAIKHLQMNGYDTAKIQSRIDSIIVRTILASYTKLLRSYRKTRQVNTSYSPVKDQAKFKEEAVNQFNQDEPSVCFQLLGFDILLLETGQPILLQINHQPSLIADSPFDMAVKKSLFMDTVNMLNLDQKQKEQWQRCQRQGLPYKHKHMEEKQLQNKGGFKCIYPLNHIKYNGMTKQQIEQIQNTKYFYETIMNKFLFREFKDIHKIKITNYRTITSRVNSRRAQNPQKQVNNQQDTDKLNFVTTEGRKYKTSVSSQKPKAVALTFYNLFSDAKYHIKGGSSFLQRPDKKQEADSSQNILKGKIYLASVEESNNNIPLHEEYNKKIKKNPYITPSTSKQKVRPKRQIMDPDVHNFILKEPSFQKQFVPNINNPSAVLADDKFRQNIASIRNRGIMSYIASKRQKRNINKKEQKHEKLQLQSFSLEGRETSKNSLREQSHSRDKNQQSQWRRTIKKLSEQKQKLNNDPIGKMRQFKNIYINSLSEKCQKVINPKIDKNSYQKLNFTSFIQMKKKQRKEDQKIAKQISYEQKKTSPSAQ